MVPIRPARPLDAVPRTGRAVACLRQRTMPPPLDDEIRYRLLKLLEERPHLTQRELAKAMGISLGKVNYCLRAFAEEGWIRIKRYSRSSRKAGYVYLLTPKGLREKSRATLRFLQHKLRQYEKIKQEIAQLRSEHEAGANRQSGRDNRAERG